MDKVTVKRVENKPQHNSDMERFRRRLLGDPGLHRDLKNLRTLYYSGQRPQPKMYIFRLVIPVFSIMLVEVRKCSLTTISTSSTTTSTVTITARTDATLAANTSTATTITAAKPTSKRTTAATTRTTETTATTIITPDSVLKTPNCTSTSAVNTTAFQVNWQHDNTGEAIQFLIQVDKSDSNINVSRNTACSSSQMCNYIVTGLNPGSRHDIEIFASSNGVLNNESCNIYGATMPEAPICLNVTSLSPKSIHVYWQINDTGGTTYFQISYNGSNNYISVSRDSACTRNSTICNHSISDLKPGKAYDIQIFASAHGIQSTKCWIAVITMPEKPLCLNMTTLNTSSVQVYWQIQNRPGATYFQISHNGSGNPSNISKDSACSNNSKLCTHVITDLEPGTTYDVHIFASVYGVLSDKCSLAGTTMPETPICLNTTALNTTSLRVCWQIQNTSGATYFHINHNGSANFNNILKENACPSDSKLCIHAITDLEPGTSYAIQIFASAYGVQSDKCFLSGITMPEKPICLNMTALNTTSVQVYWEIQNRPGATYFQISHNGSGNPSNISKDSACSNNSKLCTHAITDLEPGRIYDVHIFAFPYGIQSEKCSLSGSAMPEAPICLNVTSLSPKSLFVYWQISNSGGATYFQISYNGSNNPTNVAKDSACTPNSTVCSRIISDLDPGKMYDIQIFASAYEIQSSQCLLAGITMPEAPMCLNITSLGPTALQLYWLVNHTGGAADFHISYNGSATYINISRESACSPNSTLCNHNITDLQPGKTYGIHILASTHDVQNSQSCSLLGTTMPNTPDCSKVRTSSTSALQVFWRINATNGATDFQIRVGDRNETVSKTSICGASSFFYFCEYNVTGLNPGIMYDIAIFASTNGVQNDKFCYLQGVTMPEAPTCLNVTSLSPTVLQVQWQINYTGGATYFQIIHNGFSSYINVSRDSACSSSTTICSVNITALGPGKTYSMALLAFAHGIQNNQTCPFLGTTMPNAPNCSHVSALNTSALQVNWYKDSDGGGTDFVIQLDGSVYNYTVSNETACSSSPHCSYTINGLVPGSEHEIKILASSYGVLNNVECSLFGITMPEAPMCLNVTSVGPTALQVYWRVNYTAGAADFHISHNGSASYANVSRESACSPYSTLCNHNITDLQPGKTYDIHILASTHEVQNSQSCSLLGTTMPNTPVCSQVKTLSTSAIQVFWRINITDGATDFQIRLGDRNETVIMTVICGASSSFHLCEYSVTELNPGSMYDIAIFASTNGIQNDRFCSLHGTTMPEAPTCLNVTSLSPTVLQVQWQINYTGGATYFQIIHNGSASYINVSRDIACSSSTTICSVNITALGPGKTYSMELLAFAHGIQNNQSCLLLGTTMPNAPNCSHVSALNTSALQVNWYKDSDGGGTDFVIQLHGSLYNYTVSNETACSSSPHCSYTINGLVPGSENDIKIFASSYGVWNNLACSLFGITMPIPPTCLNATAVNTSAVRLFWQNHAGATHFQIKLDTDTNDTYTNVSSKIDCLSSSVCSRVINDLIPGSRHVLKIFASSQEVQNIQSCSILGIAVPSEPSGYQTLERTSHNFTIRWEDGSGYRDFYRVYYNCSSPNKPIENWQNHHDLNQTVKNYTSIYLEPGTQCELKVYAVVLKEILSSPLIGYVSTTETAPGPVSYFNISEVASTYVTINWLPPSKRNGIIRGYILTVKEKDGYCLEKPACVQHTNFSKESGGQKDYICQDIEPLTESASCSTYISPNCGSFLLGNLKPYVTYLIGIKAYTSCSGHQILLNATTLSTAPPYPTRTPTQSTAHVTDRTRQIAVDLPLSDFLCNTIFGSPERWGVLASQYSKATDDPFRGNASDFRTKLSLKYKSWRDIKDEDSFPPYRATHAAWKPTESCVSPARKRRSTGKHNEPDSVSYIIGQDGDCSGSGQLFCNGYLKPNTEYSFRVYVCTSEGCTESFWSPPIKTDKDSTTLIIALSVLASLLLLGIVAVVILKMRRMLCFKVYKIEEDETFTHDTPFGIGGSKVTIHRPVKLSELQAHVDSMHRDSNVGFSSEYKFLKEIEPKHSTEVAESQACRSKNRYTNILPYDHSRVKLLPTEDEEGSDYINANYIQGYNSKREYIATQGPLPATRDDFWRMVWEQSAEIIVMLTKCTEKGRVKCDKYWPEVNEPVYHGELIVNVTSESILGDYIIRVVELRLTQMTRKVYHFSFLNWPDMGCPKDPAALLNFVTSVRTYVKPNFQSPIVLHCSAGVGRTGTFIAIDHLMQHVRDYDEVDIFNLVYEMRNQRCNMVQTEDQYVYIHDSILQCVTEDEDDEEEHIYVNKPIDADNVYENTAFIQD